jgi:hypothetical protein
MRFAALLDELCQNPIHLIFILTRSHWHDEFIGHEGMICRITRGFFACWHPIVISNHELSIFPSGSQYGVGKTGQNSTGRNPLEASHSTIATMAAPSILLRIFRQSGSYRIQVDVPDQTQKVSIIRDEKCAVSSLEDVTGPFTPLIEITRISRRQPAH